MDISLLTFDVAASDANKPLGFEFWVNDQQIVNIDQLMGCVPVGYEFDNEQDQQYSIKIVVKNKTADYTTIDEQGNIVRDSLLEIKNFKLGDFNIDQIVQTIAVYRHNFNGSKDWVDGRFYQQAGCNGTITFEFYTPTLLWLLEKT